MKRRRLAWIPAPVLLALAVGHSAPQRQPDAGSLPPVLTSLGKLVGQVSFRDGTLTPNSVIVLQQQLKIARAAGGEGPAADTQYKNFVNRSLLIRDHNVLDSPGFQRWAFAPLIRRTFSTLGYSGSVDQAVKDWGSNLERSLFANWWRQNNGTANLDAVPLRLLAVANRLDKGQPCPSGTCGAEIRFVYGGTPYADIQHPYFTLGLEYVLDFQDGKLQDAARSWANLDNDQLWSNAGDAAGEVGKALDTMYSLWSQGSMTVRIRVNSRASDAGLWTLEQYFLSGQAPPFAQAPLDQQYTTSLDDRCVSRKLRDYVLTPELRQSVIHNGYNFFQPPGSCSVGSSRRTAKVTGRHDSLATCDPKLPNQYVLTLDKGIVATGVRNDVSVDDLRQAFSFNSCTGCHGIETKGVKGQSYDDGGDPAMDEYTHFDQIKYREAGQDSMLAAFFTGGSNTDPLLAPWTIDKPHVMPGCGDPPQSRSYNYLLMRALFHTVLLNPLFPNPWKIITDNGYFTPRAD